MMDPSIFPSSTSVNFYDQEIPQEMLGVEEVENISFYEEDWDTSLFGSVIIVYE